MNSYNASQPSAFAVSPLCPESRAGRGCGQPAVPLWVGSRGPLHLPALLSLCFSCFVWRGFLCSFTKQLVGCVLTRSNKQAGLAETWKLKMSPPLNASRLLCGHLWALFLFYFLILLPQWRCISIKMGQSESFVHPWIRMDLEVPWRPGFHHWTL